MPAVLMASMTTVVSSAGPAIETKRCIYCASLTIQKLVELAEKETPGPGGAFPRHHYYQHQPSIRDLEYSANDGCDLCLLIVETCKKTFEEDEPLLRRWGSNIQGPPAPVSMYTVAKSREFSQVKLAIKDSWKVEDNLIIFDQLHVLVDTHLDKWDVLARELSPSPILKFLIKTSRDRPCFVNGSRIGRFETNRDFGADDNFLLANSWLQNCREEHRQCWTNTSGWLPTRVIDVSVEPPRLILSCGAKGQYIALSHCWGGSIPVCLTKDTIDTFREGLPFEMLAKNFRDAIIISQRLGIRYLWIDCLCIIQNSREDWAKESKMMGKVYHDATLTIYASASIASTAGILRKVQDYQQRRAAAVQVSPGSVSEVEVNEFGLSQFHPDIDVEGPLNKRGWTLQELALCPRQLLYGKHHLYWRCREEFLCSNGLPIPKSQVRPQAISLTTLLDDAPCPTLTPDEKSEAMGKFHRLVEIYSKRALTFDSDRLPALSGLSERLHKYIGGAYLAGIWECSLATGLLWTKGSRRAARVRARGTPSWSWASCNGAVYFHDVSTLGCGELDFVEYYVQLCDQSNPYGELKSGRLTVRGLLLPLVRSRQHTELEDSSETPTITFDDEDVPPEGVAKQRLVFMEQGEGHGSCIVSLPQTTDELPYFEMDTTFWSNDEYSALLVSRSPEKDRFRGLVLRPRVNGEQTFERVGIFDGPEHLLDDQLESWKIETVTLV